MWINIRRNCKWLYTTCTRSCPRYLKHNCGQISLRVKRMYGLWDRLIQLRANNCATCNCPIHFYSHVHGAPIHQVRWQHRCWDMCKMALGEYMALRKNTTSCSLASQEVSRQRPI